MKTFILGFVAGAATYHFVSGGFNNEELVTELRGAIQKLDDRLAEKDNSVKETGEPFTTTEESAI